jgi:hypothetical protein
VLEQRSGRGAWLQHSRAIRARATSVQAGGLFALPNSARARGIACISAPGTGKSTFFGRVLAFLDYVLERPQVIIDPTGGTIDQFLDQVASRLAFLPKSKRTAYWERIRYIDMGSKAFVCPFPLYYRLGTEQSLLEVSERYLELILKSNPWLLTAQVLGWPPLHDVGAHTGMLLAALDLQITSAQDLLSHPEAWEGRFTEAVRRFPEAAPAVAYFRDEYIPMRPADRRRLTNPFFEKIFTFNLDPQLKAMFGSSKPGINFADVSANKQTVLFDFRTVRGENRRFKLLWVFAYLYEWIKARGRREQPFGLIIDEFVALTQKVLAGENPLAVELDEFIQQYMRSSQIWLTIGFQSPHQLDEHLQQTVLSLGTYLIGQAATMQAARLLADAMFLRDPWWVKYWRTVYVPVPRWARSSSETYELPQEPEFMPLEEQTELFANRIRKLKQYQFLVRPAVSEGEISTTVLPITISAVTKDPVTGKQHFPERDYIAEIRAVLAAKAGKPVKQLLEEQEASLARYTQVVDGLLRNPQSLIQRGTHNRETASTRPEPQQPVSPVTKPRSAVNRRVRLS